MLEAESSAHPQYEIIDITRRKESNEFAMRHVYCSTKCSKKVEERILSNAVVVTYCSRSTLWQPKPLWKLSAIYFADRMRQSASESIKAS